MMEDVIADPAPSQPKQRASTRFAFAGAAENVLREYLSRDANGARLSWKFKLYYRLRPVIPVRMRQMLQRGRNQGIDAVFQLIKQPGVLLGAQPDHRQATKIIDVDLDVDNRHQFG